MPDAEKLTRIASRAPVLWASLGLVALVMLVYLRVGGHGFTVMDDPDYVVRNPVVNSGLTWEGARWAFSEPHLANWHPLTWLSHMADCEFFGLTPGAHHLVNVVLHAANAVLLFLAMRMMTGTFWRSLGVAVIFALHPQRVESVAWISERKDVLSGFFWMLALVSYAWYARRPGWVRYACLFAAMALGLMSKSMLVTLPFVLLLLDFWPLGRSNWKKLVMEKLPLLALAAGASVMAFAGQSDGKLVTHGSGAVAGFDQVGFMVRVANALESWAAYLWQMAWPFELAPFYPHPSVDSANLLWGLYVPAAVAAVILPAVTWAVIWAAFWAKKKRAWPAVGWFWYVGTLVPVIGIIQIGLQARADRYTYLPMIGIAIMLAWGVGELAARWPGAKKVVWGGAAAVLCGWMALTWVQVSYWRDDFKLFGRAIQVTDKSFFAHNELGMAHQEAGDLLRAVEHFNKAIEIHPTFGFAHNNIGLCLMALNQYEIAEWHFKRTMELKMPRTLGLRHLALLYTKQGRYAEAAEFLKESITLDPNDSWTHSALAMVYAFLREDARIDEPFQRALELGPRQAETFSNLGNVCILRRRYAEAEGYLKEVLRYSPNDIPAHAGLGVVYSNLGRFEEGEAEFNHALSLSPSNTELLNNLGALYMRKGDLTQASACLEEVLKIDPENALATRNLARLKELK